MLFFNCFLIDKVLNEIEQAECTKEETDQANDKHRCHQDDT